MWVYHVPTKSNQVGNTQTKTETFGENKSTLLPVSRAAACFIHTGLMFKGLDVGPERQRLDAQVCKASNGECTNLRSPKTDTAQALIENFYHMPGTVQVLLVHHHMKQREVAECANRQRFHDTTCPLGELGLCHSEGIDWPQKFEWHSYRP